MKDDKMLYYNLKLNGEYFLYMQGEKWSLQRNKVVIYEVMNQENNTQDELKAFVKEHTIYDYSMIACVRTIITSLFVCILSIINLKYKLVEIRYFIYGALFVILTEILVRTIVNSHNNKIRQKIYKEDMKFFDDRREQLQKKLDKIKKDKKKS